MKNQYFGDINDYRKYGLLRILADSGKLKIGICWMLTSDDKRSDGRRISYLQSPSKWSDYDKDLFEQLKDCVKKARDIRQAERHCLIPSAIYFTENLPDQCDQRQVFFEKMLQRFKDRDLIFFDPDNGLEIKSKPKGRKHSSKYVYWDEVSSAFKQGHSILIYQHFPRNKKRKDFITEKAAVLRDRTSAAEVYSFRTPYTAFFLAVPEKQLENFGKQAEEETKGWKEQIEGVLSALCALGTLRLQT